MIHFVTPAPRGPANTSTPGERLPPGLSLGRPGARVAFACGTAWPTELHVQAGQDEQGTGEPFLVTCPKCRATPAFQAALDAWAKGQDPERMPDCMRPAYEAWVAAQTPV